MKLTLLKWKYQIWHRTDDFFYVYHCPYGFFSFLTIKKCEGVFSSEEDAKNLCEKLLSKPKIETKIIKEYLIEE